MSGVFLLSIWDSDTWFQIPGFRYQVSFIGFHISWVSDNWLQILGSDTWIQLRYPVFRYRVSVKGVLNAWFRTPNVVYQYLVSGFRWKRLIILDSLNIFYYYTLHFRGFSEGNQRNQKENKRNQLNNISLQKYWNQQNCFAPFMKPGFRYWL